MEIGQIEKMQLNFIFATARTGSTLLSSMLNSHPNVISTIEEPFAFNLYPKYKKIKKWTSKTIDDFCYDFYLFSEGRLGVQFGTKKELQGLLEINKQNLNVEIAVKLAYLCFFPNKDKSDIRAIVDKQLEFHFYMGKLAGFYPKSKFIILYRDPRDSAVTKWLWFRRKGQPRKQNYYNIASVWKYVYGKFRESKSKIENERILEVKYEDLVSDTESELKKICKFICVPYDSAMLKYNEQIKKENAMNELRKNLSVKNNFELFHEGLTQKVYTSKVGYWNAHLKLNDANLIMTVCGELAEKIGYKIHPGFTVEPIPVKSYLHGLTISIRRRLLTRAYHNAPFFFKFILKKIKYGKKFKQSKWTNDKFYQKSYDGLEISND